MKNKKLVLILSLVIILLVMAGGYAVYSSSLKVEGTGSIDSNFNIEVTNIKEESKSGKAVSVTEPTYTSSTATFNTKLQRPGDNIEYLVEITNNGTVDGKINALTITNPSDIVKVETRGIIEGEIIKSGEVKSYIVRIYIEEGTKLTEDVTSQIEVNAEIIQDDNQIFNEGIDGTLENKLVIESTKEESDYTSIKATVNASGNGLKYYYSLDNENWTEASVSNTYTFTGLEIGKRYTVYYKVEDENLNYVTDSKWIETKGIDSPVIKVSNENEWTQSKDVTIEYPEIEGAVYQYKIGSGEWQDASSSQNVVVTENIVVYAKIIYGENEIESEKEVSKIDSGEILLELATSATTNSITVVANANTLSGINKYEFSIDGGSTWIDNEKYNNYTFKGLTHDTEYEILVRVTNNVDKKSISTIASKTKLIETPTFEEEIDGEVLITYPSGCSDIYVCSYIKDSEEEVIVAENPKVTFGATGTLIAKVTDGRNYITSSAYTVERTNLYVASTGNDTTGYGTIVAPYATLNKAYDSASLTQESTIYVMDDLSLTKTTTLDENKTVTLTSYGDTHTISKAVAINDELISIESGTLTLEHISLDGKNISDIRGGVGLNDKLIVREGTIIRNFISTDWCGGAINVGETATLTMTDGLISNNQAYCGGGIHIGHVDSSSISGVTISDNISLTAEAGGISIYGNVNISDSIISNNVSNYSGGGMIVSYNSIVNVKNTQINNNSASRMGGGAVIYSGNCTFIDSFIKNNIAIEHGGGISVYQKDATCTIEETEISGNESSSYYGGGIHTIGTVTMTSGLISNNSAIYGGGVYLDTGTFHFNGGEIDGNTTPNSGGGIYNNVGIMTMAGGSVTNNKCNVGGGGIYTTTSASLSMTGGSVSNNTAGTSGGGMYVGGTLDLNGGEILNNVASTGVGGGVRCYNCTFDFKKGKISGNTAHRGGGVEYYSVNNTNFTMTGGEIDNNKALTYEAGGVFIQKGVFTMSSGQIYSNTATTRGGGVFLDEAIFNFNGGTIYNNVAINGGGLFKGDGTYYNNGGTFSNNSPNDVAS